MSPTARTLTVLRRLGYLPAIVERWIPGANVRRDLYGCIDIVAIQANEHGVLGIQATSLPNISARLKKAKALPALEIWLLAGNRFEVWGWRGSEVKRVSVLPGDTKPTVVAKPKRRTGKRGQQRLLFS